MIAGLSKDNYEPPKSSRLVPAIRHKGTYKEPQGTSRNYKELQGTSRNFKEPTRHNMSAANATSPTGSTCFEEFVEHSVGSLQFSAYHFHHNREPYYILFIRVMSEASGASEANGKGEDKIYIEKIDTHSHRNKYVNDIVMPLSVMESNANLKKYYDMSVMLVNTDKSVYYDTRGLYSKRLIQTYDTDSDSDDDEEKEKTKRSVRRWCISCDTVWKNLRVSKNSYFNCYYNINPYEYEYKMGTEKEINQFISLFNSFAKYSNIPSAIEKEIIANYNDVPQLTRDAVRL